VRRVLKTGDGQTAGNLTVKETSGWGLGPFFRRRGGDVGDTLLLLFDLKAHETVITVGDESLVEQFDPNDNSETNPQESD
jgi:hypothetical protein